MRNMGAPILGRSLPRCRPNSCAACMALLGRRIEAFLASYAAAARSGLRVNTLKLSPDEFRALSPLPLTPVPWCPAGFLLPAEHEAGKHPFHAAGLYYLQSRARWRRRVARAAGGARARSLRRAGWQVHPSVAQLRGTGCSSPTNHPAAPHLGENLERWGASNAADHAETPERLAANGRASLIACWWTRPVRARACFARARRQRKSGRRSSWRAARCARAASLTRRRSWYGPAERCLFHLHLCAGGG